MSRPVVLTMPQMREPLVLDDEACRLGIRSAARQAVELERADAATARQHEHDAQMQQLRSLAQGLLAAAGELAAQRKALLDQLEPQVVRLALAIAARLVLRELDADDPRPAEAALGAVREALKDLPSHDLLRVRLNRHDRKTLAQALGEEPEAEGVEIAVDGSIARGGCVVDTRFGTIDATVETRWARMVEALTAQRTGQPGRTEAEQ